MGEEIKKLISSVMSGIFRMLRLSLLFPEIRKTKDYVQHMIKKNQEMICKYILDMGGWFFITGNSKNVPTQVRDSLVGALATRMGYTSGQEMAEKFVEKWAPKERHQTGTCA